MTIADYLRTEGEAIGEARGEARGEAHGKAKGMTIGKIQMLEQFLGMPASSLKDLEATQLSDLEQTLAVLNAEYVRRFKPKV